MVKKTTWYNNKFKNLSNEEIYILGFLWADGYLNGSPDIKNNLQIEIIYKDFMDIESIFDTVGKWGKYIRKASIKKGVKRQKRICISISSRELVRKLITLEFDKKNNTSPIQILKLIPPKKQYLFVRGYVDGDGCYYITKNAHQFCISSNYNQDWTWIEELFHKLNITKFQIIRDISKEKHKYSRIRTSSRESMEKLVRYIYQDNINIGLTRKFNKVKHLLKE